MSETILKKKQNKKKKKQAPGFGFRFSSINSKIVLLKAGACQVNNLKFS